MPGDISRNIVPVNEIWQDWFDVGFYMEEIGADRKKFKSYIANEIKILTSHCQ